MSCIPATPVVPSLLSTQATQGWSSLGTGLITTALSQYFPILAGVVPYYDVFQTTGQHAIIRQLEFEETASSAANIRKVPLIVAIYAGSTTPTTPTSGAVYNPSTTGLIGCIEIAEADYKRTSDTVWTAVVNPNRYIRSGELSASDDNVNLVILSNSATTKTYAAGAQGRIRMITELGTAL
ncbi:MAG TPA: hypothetical protein DCZ59_04330 [Bacteroidetes bacterium]|nr:hypothetical protein [Bacteroidota bacterium]